MVYGFANQSGGFVSIDSELGRGTTVKLFLPRTKNASPRFAREAGDGDSALAALANGAAIDLLFTDVVLPGAMSGPQIAEEARRRNPDIKVLFMSGYPDKMSHHQDLSEDNVELLAKPFRKSEMARKVRTPSISSHVFDGADDAV